MGLFGRAKLSTARERQEAFDALYRAYYARVLAYVRRRVSPDAAQDAVAETFCIAWRRLDAVPNEALPWLLAVARNVLANERRSIVRGKNLVDALRAEESARAGAEEEPSASLHDILQALEQLSLDDQETLKLVAWDGLSMADAATVVGASATAFRVRLHRARRRLEASLNADEAPPRRRKQSFPALPEEP